MSMESKNSLRTVFALIALPMFLQGCADSNMDDLRAYVEEVKARKPGRIEPLPELQQVETFVFDPTGLRNPFKPESGAPDDEPVASTTTLQPDRERSKEELELIPLDSIRMVGTLEQDQQVWGLVTTADGTIHRVQSGNYMGQNYGRITSVEEGGIFLTEIVSDGRGGYRERQAEVALSE